MSAFDIVIPDLAIVDLGLSDRLAINIAIAPPRRLCRSSCWASSRDDELCETKPYPILAKPFDMGDLVESARWLVAQTLHCRQILGDNLELMLRLQRELQDAISVSKVLRAAVGESLKRSRRQREIDL